MSTYKTGNPLGSAAAKDLYDNAQNLDQAVNGTDITWKDRFDRTRRSLAGIDYDANQAMIKYGYITVRSFELGATLETPNSVLQWESNGEFYRWDGDWSQPVVVPSGSTPESAGGIGTGKWVSVGDAAVRANLASFDAAFGDAMLAVQVSFSFGAQRTQHQKNNDAISALDISGISADGVTDDTARFAALEAEITGRVINLAGKAYYVTTPPVGNSYVNGRFITPSLDTGNNVTLEQPTGGDVISSTTDTGSYEAKYQNPLTGDYQISGRSNNFLFVNIASQNSRAAGPARAVNFGSIYSYATGNVSGNYSARQCRATVPQSVNIGSEDCRVDGGFRGSNISSITSHVTGETGVNLGSRRGWATSFHSVNIASVDAYAGGGRGAVLKAVVNNDGTIAAVTIVAAGTGYSSGAVVAFYDRLSAPTVTAVATCTIDANGAIIAVNVTTPGAGYSTATSDLYDVVQATIRDAGNYSANIATANGCVTYGEVSFNLGTNNCAAKANRSGNIGSNASNTSGQYAVNIGTDTSSNAGAQSVILGGGGNTITSAGTASAILAGNNSSIALTGCVLFGRRVSPRNVRSFVYGDAASGTAASANIKLEMLTNGNMNIAGTLTQNTTFTDVAKMFENIEQVAIPVGSLVSWEGRKVRLARKGDIECSAHSRTYAILLGDSQFTWADRYLRDEFGEIMMGEFTDPESSWDETLNNGEGGWVSAVVIKELENPDFDATQEQIPRSQRRDEWTPVALIGEVHVRVDNTVVVDSYIVPSDVGGLGTKSDSQTRMRCMEIRSEYDAKKGYAVALCLRA